MTRSPLASEPLRKGDRTRERILLTATALFHERGVNATSLGEVLRASGTGKGQFYQHFSGRDDLVRHVLERHREFLAGVGPIADWDDLRAWLHHYLEMQRRFHYQRGCPVGTAAYALQPGQDEPRAVLRQIFGAMRGSLEAFFRGEQEGARLRQEADPERLANFTVAAVQGAMLLGLLDRGPDASRAVVDEVFTHVRSYAIERRG